MQRDNWASGDAYEPYVGRWSRAVAQRFLAWLDVPAGARWLDVGCGTGALSETILEIAAPSEVVGIDPSAEYVAYARRRVPDPVLASTSRTPVPFPLRSERSTEWFLVSSSILCLTQPRR